MTTDEPKLLHVLLDVFFGIPFYLALVRKVKRKAASAARTD